MLAEEEPTFMNASNAEEVSVEQSSSNNSLQESIVDIDVLQNYGIVNGGTIQNCVIENLEWSRS